VSRQLVIEGVPYQRFRVTFRLTDGRRRRWMRWSPGWTWVYDSVARELYETFGDRSVRAGSLRIEAAP
jgi:hypothetical protein